jgi:hypothetical protein
MIYSTYPTRLTRGRLPCLLKHGYAGNVSAHFSGTPPTNCTSEVMRLNVTSVTDCEPTRAGPKVTFSGGQE